MLRKTERYGPGPPPHCIGAATRRHPHAEVEGCQLPGPEPSSPEAKSSGET
jgi:hypothetical protein